MVKLHRCDACGRETSDTMGGLRDWWHLSQPCRPFDDHVFCSLACVADWAGGRVFRVTPADDEEEA